MFITFEGGEGVGKTTLINIVKKRLQDLGYEVVITREPGGTKKAEEIRNILLTNENLTNEQRMDLFVEARIDHNNEIIKPNLKNNVIVISDRYFDSMFVYQGIFSSDEDFKLCVKKNLTSEIEIPDFTFIFDLEPEIAVKRLNDNNREKNFLDELPIQHHSKIRNGYLKLVEKKNEYFSFEFSKQKTVIIDANNSRDDIADNIMEYLQKTLIK